MIGQFENLCHFLKFNAIHRIYLIHEPDREIQARKFAEKLKNEGFHPLIAKDFRDRGEIAVKEAIKWSDLSLVIAFDLKTVKKAQDLGVKFIYIER